MRGRYSRVNLPAALEAEYELEGEIGSGGEADLLRARRRASGELVVVRHHRRPATLDSSLLTRLSRADRRHLIGVLDWGQDADATWEILEYASHGSLADLARTDPFPWPADRVDQVLAQVSAALEYLHAMRMVHRDIKPSNILVRSLQPLDVVLTDFGLVRTLAATIELRTMSRTSAYAAPEAAAGSTSRALDWWSLGIVVFELITGRNPFQRPDGSWFVDQQIMSELATRDISLDAVTDDRWKLLCHGLLTRDTGHRWTGRQIAEWRSGGQPRVAARNGTTSDSTRPGSGGSGGRRTRRPFVFAHIPFDDPVALANAMRGRWDEAAWILRGQPVSAPQFLGLRDWLRSEGLNDAARILEWPSPPERMLAQLLLALDPHSPPVFRRYLLSDRTLPELINAVDGHSPESAALEAIYAEGILTVYDGRDGCTGFSQTDSRWRELVEASANYLPPEVDANVTPEQRRVVIAQMLAVALSLSPAVLLNAEAAAAKSNQEALAHPWFRQLVSHQPAPGLAAAHDAAVVLAVDVAIGRTHELRAEQARRRQLARQRRRERYGRWFTRACPLLSLLAGIISLFPFAGILFGPTAVYLAIRARRTRPGGNLSRRGLVLGLIGCLMQVPYCLFAGEWLGFIGTVVSGVRELEENINAPVG